MSKSKKIPEDLLIKALQRDIIYDVMRKEHMVREGYIPEAIPTSNHFEVMQYKNKQLGRKVWIRKNYHKLMKIGFFLLGIIVGFNIGLFMAL